MSAVAQNLQHEPASDEPPVPLVFTDSAAAKVKELVDEEGNPDLKLRVFVQGGGCFLLNIGNVSSGRPFFGPQSLAVWLALTPPLVSITLT